MEGAFFGSIIFEVTGAFTKWLFLVVRVWIKGGKPRRFKDIWSGRNRATPEDSILLGMSNVGLGMLVVVICMMILMRVLN
jgi:hypothetical protein